MSTSANCTRCHGALPAPEDQEVLSITCPYCGLVQPVPDADARHRRVLERERADLARRAHEADVERARREAARDQDDRREARKSRRGARLVTLLAMLTAPAIIAVTVFDLPARLGFGDAGEARVAQARDLLVASGCVALGAIREQYAEGPVSVTLPLEGRCVRVVAAGGPGHGRLGLRLLDADGKEVARAAASSEPQLSFCPPAPVALRYEVETGVAAKGRLSHVALACPAAPTKR